MGTRAFVFGGILIAAAVSAASVQAQEFQLNWGHYLPNGPFAEVEQGFADAVEERTEGRVKINIVFAGGLSSRSRSGRPMQRRPARPIYVRYP